METDTRQKTLLGRVGSLIKRLLVSFMNDDTHEICLMLKNETIDRLMRIQQLESCIDQAAVIERALATYEFLLEKMAAGSKIHIHHPDGTSVPLTLF